MVDFIFHIMSLFSTNNINMMINAKRCVSHLMSEETYWKRNKIL